MSDQYNNELTFRLFKNDKGDNPKRPDYRGECQVGGVTYKLSGWIGEVKSGEKAGSKYIRGKVERKEDQPRPTPQPQAGKTATMPGLAHEPSTEDVPF
jgi:hypothetical protein